MKVQCRLYLLFTTINIFLVNNYIFSQVKDSLLLKYNFNLQSQHFVENYFIDQVFPNNEMISGLYNGREYTPFPNKLKEGSIFFSVEKWNQGDIIYNGITYYHQYLKYDLLNDVLIIPYFDFENPIELVPEYIKEFHIENHCFINFNEVNYQTISAIGIKNGIYDMIYSGSSKILVKRSAFINSVPSGISIDYYPILKNHYFILKDGIYRAFSNLNSLLNILKNNKKILKKFLQNSQIKYNYNPEETMVTIAKENDQLKNK